jgi:hypothetical protein
MDLFILGLAKHSRGTRFFHNESRLHVPKNRGLMKAPASPVDARWAGRGTS